MLLYGDSGLWLENLRTHRRVKVADVAGTLRAAWFPDGAAFWLQDHRASDGAESYDAATLHRLDIRRAILAADPSMAALSDDGHRYYKVEVAGAGAPCP